MPDPNAPNDADLAAEERSLKRQEFAARLEEARVKLKGASASWWRAADPLVLAVVAGVLTLAGNLFVAWYNAKEARAQEEGRASASLQQQKSKAADDLALEREKAKANLILQAVSTNDADTARRNMLFFLDGGLIEDTNARIRTALDKYAPVLPSASGQVSAPPTTPDAYENYFWSANLRSDRLAQIDALVDKLTAAKARLERVGQAVATPWYVVGAVWIEEAGGNFAVHLHNGDPLTAQTRNFPRNRPPDWPPPAGVDPWEYSATDAMRVYKLNDLSTARIGDILARLEQSNGIGYQKRGIFSPYLWSGTDLYEKGKFLPDHYFSPDVVSQQVGIAALFRRLQDRKLIDLRGAGTTNLTRPPSPG
jgi:lysozyme family protein